MSQDPEQTTQSDPAPDRQRRGGSRRTPELEAAIGARIRAIRIAAGLSQGALGASVGISFQQIQKYELGRDRVAASTLAGIADALGVHPGLFFEEVSGPLGSIPDKKAAIKAGAVLQRVRDPRVLKHLLALAKVLTDEEDGVGKQSADQAEP